MQEKLSKNAIILIIEKLKSVFNVSTDTGLAEALGVRQNTISSWKTRGTLDYALIISKCDNIDLNWIFNDKSDDLNTKKCNTKTPQNVLKQNEDIFEDIFEDKRKVQKTSSNLGVEKVVVDNVFKLRTDRLVERQQIPIYDMEAVAGLVPLFAEHYSQSVVEVMETTLIPKCDGGLRIVGDSMYPLLKSGDIVFYKQIHDILNNIVWGEMYLISFDIDGEEYVSVKYLQKSELKDHITLVSYNEHHKPLDIHIGRIRALAFIKASLRLNSIK